MNSPSSPPWVGVPGPSASSNPPAVRANAVRTAMLAPIPNSPGENGKIADSGGGFCRLNRRARKPLFQASAVSAARSCSVSSRAASTGPLTHASVGSPANAPAMRVAHARSTSVSSSVNSTTGVVASNSPRLRPTDAPRRASRM
jgi:hypothetical protein